MVKPRMQTLAYRNQMVRVNAQLVPTAMMNDQARRDRAVRYRIYKPLRGYRPALYAGASVSRRSIPAASPNNAKTVRPVYLWGRRVRCHHMRHNTSTLGWKREGVN